MKLYYSPTSPYARKARAVTLERNLGGQVAFVPCDPHDMADGIKTINPIGKVPALVVDENTCYYDSPVICEYLASLGDGPELLPAAGDARWRVLRQQATADGVIDTGVMIVLEGRRPPEKQMADRVERWTTVIRRGLDVMQDDAAGLSPEPTLAHIAIGCALGFLDLRLAHLGWRDSHVTLAAWNDAFQQRPAMTATQPPAQ